MDETESERLLRSETSCNPWVRRRIGCETQSSVWDAIQDSGQKG